MRGRLILVLGGARSGKSTYAQYRAEELAGADVVYVATAEDLDDEMRQRIAVHRSERPAGWRTLEAPSLATADLVTQVAGAKVVLVDCLTLLTSNAVLRAGDNPDPQQAEAAVEVEIRALLDAANATDATWLVVSNEVGLGIVPANELSRSYRDALGRANQRMAAIADEVIFMVAGLQWKLK
jgi:adenosylcobinamide kinase/adenosylcobinamide-phosphate guanylyltransferase